MSVATGPARYSLPLVQRARIHARRLTWANLRRRITRLVYFAVEDRIYRLTPAEALDLPDSADFARDNWEDLERFVPTEGYMSQQALLADWRDRRSRGERVYARVEDGRLVSYGWLIERQKTCRLGWTGQHVTYPDNSAVIYDFYTLPEYRQRDFYQRLLMHVVHEAGTIPGTDWLYIVVRADDTVPRWWVERMGFTYIESFFLRRVLWWRRSWREVRR